MKFQLTQKKQACYLRLQVYEELTLNTPTVSAADHGERKQQCSQAGRPTVLTVDRNVHKPLADIPVNAMVENREQSAKDARIDDADSVAPECFLQLIIAA